MYRLYLSLRFLRHHWLMTLIGSFFVGASLVILVVVMAVMDGFQNQLRATVSGASADLILTPNYDCDLDELARSAERNLPEVVAAGPLEQTLTFVQRTNAGPLDDELTFAQVFGVDGKREQRVNSFREFLRARDEQGKRLGSTVDDPEDPFKVHDELDAASGVKGVILGVGLRNDLHVRVGDKVRMAALRRRKATGAGQDARDYEQDWLSFRVVGIYTSGHSEKDAHAVFLDWRDVQELWSSDLRRSSVRCKLTSPDALDPPHRGLYGRVKPLIMDSLVGGAPVGTEGLQPASWKDENQTLVRAIESEKSMILVIAFLIVVAGTSSIFAAQWLLVSDKVREIGILQALGAGVEGVMSVFVFNGFLMGLLGSVGGALLGLFAVDRIDGLRWLVEKITGRDPFDPRIYLFDKVPTSVHYGAVVQYSVAALVCTLIASAIPALRAGLMDPAKALHRD